MADLEATFGLDYTQFMRDANRVRAEARKLAKEASTPKSLGDGFESAGSAVRGVTKAVTGLTLGVGTIFTMFGAAKRAADEFAESHKELGDAMGQVKEAFNPYGGFGQDMAEIWNDARKSVIEYAKEIERTRQGLAGFLHDNIFARGDGSYQSKLDIKAELQNQRNRSSILQEENRAKQENAAARADLAGEKLKSLELREQIRLRDKEHQLRNRFKDHEENFRALMDVEIERGKIARDAFIKEERDRVAALAEQFRHAERLAEIKEQELAAAELLVDAEDKVGRAIARRFAVDLAARRELLDIIKDTTLTEAQRQERTDRVNRSAEEAKSRIDRDEQRKLAAQQDKLRADAEEFALEQRVQRARIGGHATEALVLERRADLEKRVREILAGGGDETTAQRVRVEGLRTLAAELRAIGEEQSRVLETQPGTRVLGAGLGAAARGFFGSGSLGRPDTQRDRAAQETLKAQREANKVLEEIAENTRGGAAARFGR